MAMGSKMGRSCSTQNVIKNLCCNKEKHEDRETRKPELAIKQYRTYDEVLKSQVSACFDLSFICKTKSLLPPDRQASASSQPQNSTVLVPCDHLSNRNWTWKNLQPDIPPKQVVTFESPLPSGHHWSSNHPTAMENGILQNLNHQINQINTHQTKDHVEKTSSTFMGHVPCPGTIAGSPPLRSLAPWLCEPPSNHLAACHRVPLGAIFGSHKHKKKMKIAERLRISRNSALANVSGILLIHAYLCI